MTTNIENIIKRFNAGEPVLLEQTEGQLDEPVYVDTPEGGEAILLQVDGEPVELAFGKLDTVPETIYSYADGFNFSEVIGYRIEGGAIVWAED